MNSFRKILVPRKNGLVMAHRFTSSEHAHAANPEMWERVFKYFCLPVLALASVNTYLDHVEESKHPRPEFKPYEYLAVRRSRYPWGDGNHSLFHNPYTNALPDGYEAEDPVSKH